MISPLLQRALALLLVVGSALLFFFAVVGPYVSLVSSKQQNILNLEDALGRYQQIERKAERYREVLNDGSSPQFASLLFAPQSPSLAAAELQRLLTDGFRERKITGGTFRPLPDKTEGGLVRFGVRAHFRATAFQLLELLSALAGDSRFYRLENINIQSPRAQTSGQDPVLTIQMDIFAFMEAADV